MSGVIIMIVQVVIAWMRQTLEHVGKTARETLEHDGEAGQGLVEYALILVLVSVVTLALMVLIGPQIANMFGNIVDSMRAAGG